MIQYYYWIILIPLLHFHFQVIKFMEQSSKYLELVFWKNNVDFDNSGKYPISYLLHSHVDGISWILDRLQFFFNVVKAHLFDNINTNLMNTIEFIIIINNSTCSFLESSLNNKFRKTESNFSNSLNLSSLLRHDE